MEELKPYIPQIIATAVAIVAFMLFRYLIRKLVIAHGETSNKAQGRMRQTQQVLIVTLNILFIFSIAAIWGLRGDKIIGGLVAMFTVIGVAFFAQWSILSNLTAGIIMYFSAPYRIGDCIHIIDKDMPIDATIENILSFYIHLRTDEGELIVLSNSNFMQKMVALKDDKEGGK